MPKCPVCETDYLEKGTSSCSVCGWDLTPDPPRSRSSSTHLKKEEARLAWARQMWQRSRLQTWDARFDELQTQLQQASIERSQLQSQLEWVLYRLEQMNPEFIVETLSRLEEKIAALPEPTPPLSEVGIDYSQLIALLAAGKWRKADELTWTLVLRITLREEEDSLTGEDIQRFPSTDLLTIDRLWEYYSNGQFGLNIQRQIWESVGSQYTQLCDCVGWRTGENWIYYDELNFTLQAPPGHLPILAWRRRACYGTGKGTAGETFFHLASRLLTLSTPDT